MFFGFGSIPHRCKTQKICGRIVSEEPSFIIYCPDEYIAQRMCDGTVDHSLAALKLIPDCFVTSKMIKKILYCFVRI